MTSRFDGKVVVITGAAGGIGRATAVRFAQEWARVVLVDLTVAPLDEAVAAVEGAGGMVLAVQADVTDGARPLSSNGAGSYGKASSFVDRAVGVWQPEGGWTLLNSRASVSRGSEPYAMALCLLADRLEAAEVE